MQPFLQFLLVLGPDDVVIRAIGSSAVVVAGLQSFNSSGEGAGIGTGVLLHCRRRRAGCPAHVRYRNGIKRAVRAAAL